MADGQGPSLQCEVEADVPALCDQGDAPFHSGEALLIRPQGSTHCGRHRAVAVRANHRHAVRGGQQILLEGPTVVPYLGETRRIADGGTCSHGGQPSHHVDGGITIDSHQGGVGNTGKGVHGRKARNSVQ